MQIPSNAYAIIYDIKFYLCDENGDELLNEEGGTRLFTILDGVRFKPLEYLCEGLDIEMLQEIKGE